MTTDQQMEELLRRINDSRFGFFDQAQQLSVLEAARRAKYDEAAAMDAQVQHASSGNFAMMYDIRYVDDKGKVRDEHWADMTWSEAFTDFQKLSERGYRPVYCRPVANTLHSQELAQKRSALYDEAAEIEAQIQVLRNRYRLPNVEQDD